MELYFECPHCKLLFSVKKKELNCGIFRHAVYKHNLQPINPHETKEICDNLVKDDLVYGCAKPFEIIKNNDKYIVQICEYI